MVRGYKVFNPDWTCNGKQYACPGKFEISAKPSVCRYGMHFCKVVADCFYYYDFDSKNHVAEVIAYGDVDENGIKCATDKLEIVREIPWDEVLQMVNTGNGNSGSWNTGSWNTGSWNTGSWNSGDWNTGNRNSGNGNSGNGNSGSWNTGSWNTGNRNSGDLNTGDWNTGNWNTGDWNKSSFNTGCFMTKEHPVMMFDKTSDWFYKDWLRSEAKGLLMQMPKNVVEWIDSSDMTDEEKAAHPTHETTGGYLKELDESERGQIWWESLTAYQKDVIKSIPNFDPRIFEKITGIKVD